MLEDLIAKRLGDDCFLQVVRDAKEGHLCSAEGLYLPRNWELETRILEKIREIWARPCESVVFGGLAGLEESQAKAIVNGAKKMLTIFTGGPGTGKTYTACQFIRLLAPRKVVIAAPTGKAAAHLESVLGDYPCESTTLHRLLNLSPGIQRLQSTRKIDADLVVVDEASMLDPMLLLHLLNALDPATRLLLLGDPDQLPPVDGGSLFPELTQLFGQKLDRSMRMGEGELYALSQAILQGDATRIPIEEWGELPVKYETDPVQCLTEQKKFRILGALRQGPLGIDALNAQILARAPKNCAVPILITQNDTRQKLYNGTTGVIHRKMAYFGERTLPESSLPGYEIAFCLSVHKSQGSEFDEVLALFPPGSERFGKEALYTAVTRAKRNVKLWMTKETLEATLKITSKKRSRFTKRFGLTSPSF